MPTPLTDPTILQDLVNHRLEAPNVEYKRWMSLSDAVARANIARHICALANAGGGFLVFGFEDDGEPSEPHPSDLAAFGQDAVNGIVERYLQPVVHCAVEQVTAATGLSYPVVCAKRDGPQDDKNRATGIQQGVHYIRVAGPKSVPIDTPERWREVIHRCVIAEREGLLGSIGRLFDQPVAIAAPAVLGPLVDHGLAEWAGVTPGWWPINHVVNRVAFGFRLATADGGAPAAIEVKALADLVRAASFAASDDIRSGATPFEMVWSNTNRPMVAVFGDVDGYAFRSTSDGAYDVPELWRVLADGSGADVLALPEDSPWVTEAVQGRSSRRWPAGAKLSPKFQVTHVAERLAFVRRLAGGFAAVTDCELMIDYAGLSGRNVEEPAPGHYFSRSYTSGVDARRVTISVPVEQLMAELPQVAARLLGPVFRLFDGWDVGSEYVAKILENPR